MKRISLVTHGLSCGGGVTTMTLFLYRVLAESGRYEPHIVSLAMSVRDDFSVRLLSPVSWRSGVRTERRRFDGVPFIHVGCCGAELEFMRYQPRRALAGILSGFDLVQFVVGSAQWAAAFPGACIWTATAVVPDRASRLGTSGFVRRTWSRAMIRMAESRERFALTHARHVFALSEYTRALVSPWVKEDRLSVASAGVDTKLFVPSVDRGGTRYIISVARWDDPRKNVGLLLDAYDMAWTPGAPELWLVGPPPDAMALRRAARLRSREHIRFLGPKAPGELAHLYRHAEFFVLSSDEEGLAIVLLEAMASGLPVVSTRSGGPEGIIEHGSTGLLTPPGDRDALSSAMATLIASETMRRQMSRRARALVEEKFGIAAAGNVFLHRYDELLENSPAARSAVTTGL